MNSPARMNAGFRARPWVGLDLGTDSIKLVAAGGARCVFAETPLPPGDDARDTPPGREALAKRIAECLSSAGLAAHAVRGVTLGVSGPDVILKQISLPLMDDAEVGPALRFESRKHLPFDPQGMVIDFQILGRSITERRMDVLFAAVAQERLESLVAPLALVGLDADIIDATPLALANALFHQVELGPATHIVLDVGSAASHLVIHQRSQPFFARRLEFGGRDMTEAITRGMKIPFEEAEAWKQAAGESASPRWDLPELGFVAEAVHFGLVEELRRSFAFYRTIGTLNDPVTLWLTGGAAQLTGLAERIGEALGITVRVLDLSPTLTDDHVAAPRPQYAQALGLALRAA